MLFLFMAGIGAGLVTFLPFFQRKSLREDGPYLYSHPANGRGALITALVVISIAGVIMWLGTWYAYTPGVHLEWWAVAAGVTIALILYAWRALRDAGPDYHAAAVITILIVMVATAGMAALKALDDNSYRVDSGTVVGQTFSPSTYMPQICSNGVCTGGYYTDDDWALKLCNHTIKPGHCTYGTLHFTVDVFPQYPVGHEYP